MTELKITYSNGTQERVTTKLSEDEVLKAMKTKWFINIKGKTHINLNNVIKIDIVEVKTK